MAQLMKANHYERKWFRTTISVVVCNGAKANFRQPFEPLEQLRNVK